MSLFHTPHMTNHHAFIDLHQAGETLRAWRERYRQRRELAQWSERELSDIGQNLSSVADEVNKPFWQA